MVSKGKILSKAPCNEDLFRGGAHRKLAKVIAEEILNDQNCSIIGIDGGWGSGKSNLVGLVKKELTNVSKPELLGKYHFFTYDAWGHQNDYPRRSILEDLTAFVTKGEDPILNSDDWRIRLDNLLAKKKKTTTKTVPSLNYALVVLALLVSLTPVINSIAKMIPTDVGRIIFTCLIYGVAIGWTCVKHYRNLKSHNQPINLESFFTELFLIYRDKIKEDEKYETISEREPSTRQFKVWMFDINKDLVERGKYLVVVIDNMDRLPKVKVQELWSAIHSFFSEEKYSNIRVIVPFDRAHIRNAFQSEDIVNSELKDAGEIAVYGDDFINKTFYIVYHVSPPILSDWKDYFVQQWHYAFGEETVVDNAVMMVYDMMTKEHTPRKIVAFINEFVTIKSIADEAIPDKYIALFIFGRAKIATDPIKEILTPTYLGALDFMFKDDKQLPSFMSSLYYQLPQAEAVDVVYTRQFARELDENNLESVKTMKASGINRFNAIMERALSEVTNTSNAALAMDDLFGEESGTTIQNFWNTLYQKDKDKRGDITKFAPYHRVLMAKVTDKSGYFRDLITGYHNSFVAESSVENYMKGIDELGCVEGIDIYGRMSKLKKEISAKQFVELVEKGGKNYKRYGMTCPDKTLSNHLAGLGISDWQNMIIVPTLDRKEYTLGSLKEKIEEAIPANASDVAVEKMLFTRLKELVVGTIDYTKYLNDNQIAQLFNAADEEFKADLISMRISRYDAFSPQFARSFTSYLNEPEDSFVEKVAQVIHRYVSYGDMLIKLKTFQNELVKKVCKIITLGSPHTQTMNVLAVAENFESIISNSEITSEELFNRMNDWRDYWNKIQKENISSIPIAFFEAAKKNGSVFSSYILKLVEGYIGDLTQEQWVNILMKENNSNLRMLKIHHVSQLPPFFDAFKQLMKGYANGENDAMNAVNARVAIEIALDLKHDVQRLFREIRDIFISTTITSQKLHYFGEWLFQYGSLERKSRCLERILPSEMLDNDEVIGLMAKNKEVLKVMIEKSEDSFEFVSTMRSMLTGTRSDDDGFKDLCDFLGRKVEEGDVEN
jgi:hypothetical protein